MTIIMLGPRLSMLGANSHLVRIVDQHYTVHVLHDGAPALLIAGARPDHGTKSIIHEGKRKGRENKSGCPAATKRR